MSTYDRQYAAEGDLFGAPYPEFDAFLQAHGRGGTALDLGCGQGRDALLLARHGYRVTGVDASHVGVEQMVAAALERDLSVEGVVADLFDYSLDQAYDAIVLDSILHFEKKDRDREIGLLNRLVNHLRPGGHLFIFVHKSSAKERALRAWYDAMDPDLHVVFEGYIDYVYEEQKTGFRSASQMFAFYLQAAP